MSVYIHISSSFSFGFSSLGISGSSTLVSSMTSGIFSTVWGGSFSDDESGCRVVGFYVKTYNLCKIPSLGMALY